METLDHLILLVPKSSLLNIPNNVSKLFNIIPGGKHADGKTFNALIVFSDGIYIELIAFENEEAREGHWWGSLPYGWIDWSLWEEPSDKKREDIKRLNCGIDYLEPKEGGRLNPQGNHIKWTVTFPQFEEQKNLKRGHVPFYCRDLTDRNWRVPVQSSSNHPSGAKRVESITLLCSEDIFEETAKFYTVLFGELLPQSNDYIKVFPAKSPNGSDIVKVFLRKADNEEEREFCLEKGDRGAVLWSVKISADIDTLNSTFAKIYLVDDQDE